MPSVRMLNKHKKGTREYGCVSWIGEKAMRPEASKSCVCVCMLLGCLLAGVELWYLSSSKGTLAQEEGDDEGGLRGGIALL